MNVLITHECSGVVREAFRALGHDARSCDLKPAEDGSDWHFECDALKAMRAAAWDIIIMHPPCTYLSVSGIHWNNRGRGWDKTNAALQHVRDCMEAATQYARVGWALENPVGLIGTRFRPADQWIQPYQYGDDASKKTGLWLHNLPKLIPDPMQYVSPRIVGVKLARTYVRWANQTDSGQNRLGPSETRAADRARTYPGIARAMAEQWGKLSPQTNRPKPPSRGLPVSPALTRPLLAQQTKTHRD